MMKRIIYLLLPLLASCGENSRSSLPTRETVSDVFAGSADSKSRVEAVAEGVYPCRKSSC